MWFSDPWTFSAGDSYRHSADLTERTVRQWKSFEKVDGDRFRTWLEITGGSEGFENHGLERFVGGVIHTLLTHAVERDVPMLAA